MGPLVRLLVAVAPLAAEAAAKAVAKARAPRVTIDPALAPEAIEVDGSRIVVGAAVGERLAKMTRKQARQWARMIGGSNGM